MEHSPLGASSSNRWFNCPGSIKLSVGIKSTTSSYAEEGTRAHDLAAQLVETHFLNSPKPVKEDWPEEMWAYCNEYYDTIRNDYTDFECIKVLIEHRFDLEKIHPGMFGTADCVMYSRKNKTLYVYDFKYGQGIPVDPDNNTQLLYYALGCMLSMDLPTTHVQLVISQPRAFHPKGTVRRWSTDSMSLMDFSADLKEYALATEAKDPKLDPGDWCRFCPASGVCPAIHKKALAMAATEFTPETKIDDKKLSELLDWLPRLEAWTKSVREYAYSVSQHGRVIPSYKLVDKRATRKWVASEKEILGSLVSLAPGDLFETKIKSPAKVEKLLDKADKETLNSLIEKKSSGTTLVHASDKRKALALGPQNDFKKLN